MDLTSYFGTLAGKMSVPPLFWSNNVQCLESWCSQVHFVNSNLDPLKRRDWSRSQSSRSVEEEPATWVLRTYIISSGLLLLKRLLQLLHLTLFLHQSLIDQSEWTEINEYAAAVCSVITEQKPDLFSVSSSLFLLLTSSNRLCSRAIFSLSEPSWASFSILFSCCRRIRCSL